MQYLIALGDKSGPDLLQKAISSAPAKWMADVTLNQLGKLQTILGALPPKGVKAVGGRWKARGGSHA